MHAELKEFIAFKIEGRHFIVRVATLYSQPIAAEEYAWLAPLAGRSRAEATDEQYETLVRLRLIETAPLTEDERYAREKRIAENAIEAVQPFTSLELMVVQGCNMRCTYCFGDAGEYGQAGTMSRETAFRAIDQMAKTHQDKNTDGTPPTILFFGGEPLLNSKLILECADYCDTLFGKNVAHLGFTTNGFLLTDDLIDRLAEHQIQFAVSFDGPYQSVNRPLKNGEDSRAMVLDRLERVKRKYGKAAVIATYYPDQDPDAIERDLMAVGGLMYKINPVSGSFCRDIRADGETRHDYRAAEETQRLTLQALDAVHRRDERAFCGVLSNRYFGKFFQDACSSPALSLHASFCGMGRDMVTVTPDGTLYPCHCFIGQKHYCQGTLDAGYERGVFAHCVTTERRECRHCPMRYGCGGGCAATFSTMTEAASLPEPIFYVPESFCNTQRLKQRLHALIFWSLDENERHWALKSRAPST